MPYHLWGYIISFAVLTAAAGFLSMCKSSLLMQNSEKLRKNAAEGNASSQKIFDFVENDGAFEETTDCAVMFLGIAIAGVFSFAFADGISEFFEKYNVPQPFSKILAFAACAFLVCFVYLIFGKLLPERLAARYNKKICTAFFPGYVFVEKIFVPLYVCTKGISKFFGKLFGVRSDTPVDEITEYEIRKLVDEGSESGAIEDREKKMIHNVFEFDDRTVSEITTHRKDVVALEINSGIDEIIKTFSENGFSRIPVYKDTLDNVVGILYAKDLINTLNFKNTDGFLLKDHMRKALYIPETNSLSELFDKFKKTRIQLAVVIDEYGGTLGIVTMEDLIESIMGSIQDEYDDFEPETDEIRKVSDGKYLIDGLTPLKNVEESLNISLLNEDDCDTIGGFIISKLERIPQENEHPEFSVDNVDFKVVSVKEHRIEKLIAKMHVKEDAKTEKEV